jgi:hypothetical protein
VLLEHDVELTQYGCSGWWKAPLRGKQSHGVSWNIFALLQDLDGGTK